MIRAKLIFSAATLTIAATIANHWPRQRDYSTGSISSDRLVEEMVRRGWWVTVESQPNGKIFASVHRGYDYDVMIDAQTANGTTRPDAVSAAALLALRGGA